MSTKIPAVGKHMITAVSAAAKPEAVAVIAQKLDMNIWAQPSRKSPNGEQLKDGAIQRMSISGDVEERAFVAANPKGVGFYKREELNTRASAGGLYHFAPWDGQEQRYKIARIFMRQRKHLHCHPTNKTDGSGWTIEFGAWGHHKAPLMGWKSGT